MSRKAGTPNKKKVEIPTGYKDDKFEIKQEVMPYYLVAESNKKDELQKIIKSLIDNYNYSCFGGVSVTNYRADNGSITMVYCQAMIRKE